VVYDDEFATTQTVRRQAERVEYLQFSKATKLQKEERGSWKQELKIIYSRRSRILLNMAFPDLSFVFSYVLTASWLTIASPAHCHPIVCIYAAVPVSGHCSIIVDSFVEVVEGHSRMSARHRSFGCAICIIHTSGVVTADSNAPAVGGRK